MSAAVFIISCNPGTTTTLVNVKMDLFQQMLDEAVSAPQALPNVSFFYEVPARCICDSSTKNATFNYEDDSKKAFDIRLMGILKQMMYVSGETAEPSAETTGMIEEIVRQQVIEMVSEISIYEIRSILCGPHILSNQVNRVMSLIKSDIRSLK